MTKRRIAIILFSLLVGSASIAILGVNKNCWDGYLCGNDYRCCASYPSGCTECIIFCK